MLNHFDFWRLLAGLGIFLFGIYLMEESIKMLAGRSFKKIVRRNTETRIKAILAGMSTTAILQSSSAIMLMILAFVGAGIMSLESAIGVVLGSNIGTTFTAWLVAVFGFKLNIESFALPLIGIGGVGMIFFPSKPRLFNLSKLLIGFGFLFHGLNYMKEGVGQLTALFDFSAVAGLGLWVFILAGLLLTALMQSSSATIAITLTAISTGAIGLRAGAGVVIGANIGTTVTAIIGAMGGVPIKKRVAYSHLIFNLVTAAAAVLLLPALIRIVVDGLGWQQQPVLGIALFHTMFNVIGVLIFLPFVSLLARIVTDLFPEPEHLFTHYIQNTSPEIPDAALAAFKKEVLHQYKESRNYLVMLYELRDFRPLKHTTPSPADQVFTGTPAEFYIRIKELHGTIFDYYSKVIAGELESDESRLLDHYLRSSRSIMNATKNLKDIHADLLENELSESLLLSNSYRNFQSRLSELIGSLDPLFTAEESQIEHIAGILDETFEKIEARDTTLIRESSDAIRKDELDDLNTTSLLMLNRLFTQSCRMLIFSLRGLLLSEEDNPEVTQKHIPAAEIENEHLV